MFIYSNVSKPCTCMLNKFSLLPYDDGGDSKMQQYQIQIGSVAKRRGKPSSALSPCHPAIAAQEDGGGGLAKSAIPSVLRVLQKLAERRGGLLLYFLKTRSWR